MPNSPLLYGPNNTAINLQNGMLQSNGMLNNMNGPKNYISYGSAENLATTGWSLGTIGTLTNGLPTGTPTFGSGAAGTLSFTTITSGPLAGVSSYSLSSSAATTAGNMVATQAYAIDIEDQAKVLTYKFSYNFSAGVANVNLSGTSSNSYGVACWDATNSVWLPVAGSFNLVQSTGAGIATGTLQTGSTTASVQLVIYAVNATAGAVTMNFDSVVLGPQTSPMAPAMSDWKSTTLTVTGIPLTSQNFFYRQVGDTFEVQGAAIASGAATGSIVIAMPNSASIDLTKTQGFPSAVGDAEAYIASVNYNGIVQVNNSTTVLLSSSTANAWGSSGPTPATWASGSSLSVKFAVPIVGKSSNSVASSDTDTRVISARYNSTAATSVTTSFVTLAYPILQYDDAGAYNSTTGVFTAPVTGKYKVGAAARIVSTAFTTAGQSLSLKLQKNGVDYSRISEARVSSAATMAQFSSGSTEVQCNAGDTLTIQVVCDVATTLDGTAIGNFVTFERLSGPAVITATESVNARYQFLSSGTVVPNATITTLSTTYATYSKIKDTHAAFSTTGVYTVPVSGTYRATLRTTIAGSTASSGYVAALIVQAGSASITTESATPFSATTTPTSATATDDFNCLAGDTLTLQVFQNNSTNTLAINASNNFNSFSIERVGN